MLKTMGSLLIASAVCTVVLSFLTDAYGISTPRQIGQSIGAGLAIFFFGAVAAFAARLIVRHRPNAGAISGLVTMAGYSALVYAGSLPG